MSGRLGGPLSGDGPRFRRESGLAADIARCPLMTQSELLRRIVPAHRCRRFLVGRRSRPSSPFSRISKLGPLGAIVKMDSTVV
jgi:hypothetical protein